MILKDVIQEVVKNADLHAKWLNTLSYMENAGARKISASEDKKKVNLIILKHAAEEHRHAYYLKKQIEKIEGVACPDYDDEFILAPSASKYYLGLLDIKVCKYLKETLNLKGQDLKFAAYLLVTYAIEVRADEIYPVYQEELSALKSKVNVKSIILEEEGHLEEMIAQLKTFSPDWEKHAEVAVKIEKELFDNWVNNLGDLLVNDKLENDRNSIL